MYPPFLRLRISDLFGNEYPGWAMGGSVTNKNNSHKSDRNAYFVWFARRDLSFPSCFLHQDHVLPSPWPSGAEGG